MRTALFNDFANFSEEFRRDLLVLWSISDEERRKLIPGIIEIARADTTGEKHVAKERAVLSASGDSAKLLRAVNVLSFIYSEWNPVQDTPTAFMEDLFSLSLLPTENTAEANAFMLAFLQRVNDENLERLKSMYAGSLLPSFIGCTVLLDARAVFDSPYGAGKNTSIDEYRPALRTWTPVFVVKFRRDSGSPIEFAFQSRPKDIRIMLDVLTAALRDLEQARIHLPALAEE